MSAVSHIAPMFRSLAIPASGMAVNKTWITMIGDNIANATTVRRTDEAAFQERFVIAQAQEYGNRPGTGVRVAAVRFGDPTGRLVYEPNHPLADEQGYVRYPDVNVADQMVNLIAAQRAYQLNVAVFERARDSIQRALEIGKP